MTKTILSSLAPLALLVVLPVEASAQMPTRAGYNPQRPTLSPYLDLFRRDGGALPNYYTFVRPKQNVLRFQQNQRRINSQLERSVVGLQQEQQAFQAAGVRATGNTGAYLNYSHFYPQASGF